jgi:hypothetical protein
MSFNNSMHWRGRAEELRGLAGQMPESVSKQLMRKIAENYECLARTAEQRVNHFPPDLLGKVVPGEVRQFARQKKPVIEAPQKISGPEIPRFLKRGPAMAEAVGAPVASARSILTQWVRMRPPTWWAGRPARDGLGTDDSHGVMRTATIEPSEHSPIDPTQLHSTWRASLQDI